jgi:hypothetical protein
MPNVRATQWLKNSLGPIRNVYHHHNITVHPSTILVFLNGTSSHQGSIRILQCIKYQVGFMHHCGTANFWCTTRVLLIREGWVSDLKMFRTAPFFSFLRSGIGSIFKQNSVHYFKKIVMRPRGNRFEFYFPPHSCARISTKPSRWL